MKCRIIALLVVFSTSLMAMESSVLVDSTWEESLFELFFGKFIGKYLLPEVDYEGWSDDEEIEEELPQDGLSRKERIDEALKTLFPIIESDDAEKLFHYLDMGPQWLKHLNFDAITFVDQNGEQVNAGELLDELSLTHEGAVNIQCLIAQSGRRHRIIEEARLMVNAGDLIAITKHVADPIIKLNPFTQIVHKGDSLGVFIEKMAASWNPINNYIAALAKDLYGNKWEEYTQEKGKWRML